MTEPGDERAAATGRLRVSDAEREQVIGALKTAFVQGRLAKDELDARVGQALASRTRAELAVLTADIPAGPADVEPARPALDLRSSARVIVAASLLAAALWAAAWFAASAAALAAAVTVSGVVILTLSVTGDQMRVSRHRRRSARPLPPGPVPGSG
jgi:hypothetical protein